MANTWRATAQAVAFGNNKAMLDIFNAGGSAKILKVRKAFQFNNGLAAVTGVLTNMTLRRTSTAAAGNVTPVAHDTTNSALAAQVTAGTGRAVTLSDMFRQYIWSNDEPTVSGATLDEWELLVPFAEVWNAGYGDANVQPVTCRAGQGFVMNHAGASVVGTNDFEIEFTEE